MISEALAYLRGGIEEREKMIHFCLVLITPEIATKMLEKNTNNRTMSGGAMNKIRHDIERNAFVETHQAVGVAPSGELVDGQHRLRAVVESGIPVEMYVAQYATEESANKAKLVIDRGKKRDLGACAEIASLVKNAGRPRVAVANMVSYIENGTGSGTLMSDSETIALVVATISAFDTIREIVTSTWGAIAFGAFVWAYQYDKRVAGLASRLENASALPDGDTLTGSEIALRDLIRSKQPGGASERLSHAVKILRGIEAWLDGDKLTRIVPVDRPAMLARYRKRTEQQSFAQAAE